MRSLLALLAVSALALAGCVTPGDVTTNTAAVDAAQVVQTIQEILAGVPCDAKVVDEKTSENLKPLAQLAFTDAKHGEIDIAGDWLLSARYAEGGFEVASIADPLRPVYLAHYQSEEKSGLDVKWMPDHETAVVGHRGTVELVDVTPVMAAGLTPEIVERDGIAPLLVSTWKYPPSPPGHVSANMHMLATARIAGTDYVYVAPNDDQGVVTLKLVGEGADRKLEMIDRVGGDVLAGGPLGPHDMSVVFDEILQKPILYIANGFEGWRAYDISDPAKPVSLAMMPNFGPAQGYTHTILGQKVGAKRLVVTIQEVGANTMTVWDATDFKLPVPVAQWRADATNPTDPQHNIQLLGGRLYAAHYGHGVYIFDLNKLDTTPLVGTTTLKPMAHFAVTKPQGATNGPTAFVNVWDVIVHDGLVYANDEHQGTSVIGFGCLTPGDSAQSTVN